MTGKKDRWADTSGGVSRTSLDGGPGPTDHRKERWVDVGTRSFDNRRESKWASKWGDKDEKEGGEGGGGKTYVESKGTGYRGGRGGEGGGSEPPRTSFQPIEGEGKGWGRWEGILG